MADRKIFNVTWATLTERLRFLWISWRRPGSLFRYDHTDCYGFGVSAYDPFRDEVLVRVSRFGYVEYESWRRRDRFLSCGEPYPTA